MRSSAIREAAERRVPMSLAEFLELGSYAVTMFGLPYAAWVFWLEQRKERENEEEEAYQHLSDAYNDFLKVVLAHSDLQLRTAADVARTLRTAGFATRKGPVFHTAIVAGVMAADTLTGSI